MLVISANSIQADDKAESRALVEQMLKPLFHLFNSLSLKSETITSAIHSSGKIFNLRRIFFIKSICLAVNIEDLEHLSHQDAIPALKNQLNCLSNLIENVQQSISILRN